MKCYAMLPNIVAHSEQVARVAVAIMDNFKDNININRKIVIVGCLLHDITKTRSLKTKEHHDISGGQLLEELGFPTIGAIVKEHVVLQNLQPEGNLLAK
ncbi:MAG: HDIG domain-containing metalloprotein, partial [Methanobacterium sp.]